ncbi:chemotaxis protein CheB [Xanthobacter autotrophicus DSM 431]|uniref:chemotaxis protein CheB n=1 Tax=Xanthobacter nonsaccharivorans TaxID=3119912 RepID=UPI0037293197
MAEARRIAAAAQGPARRTVVVGGSAGAPAALMKLLAALDPDLDAGVVIVVHLGADSPDMLPTILDTASSLPVVLAGERHPVVSGLVHVAPSGYHLLVDRDRNFALSVDDKVCCSRPSIDVLFNSAAEAYSAALAGVLLTGASGDGAEGLRRIRELGGLALVQDPAEAEVETMPRAALALAGADLCAPVSVLAARINGFGRR